MRAAVTLTARPRLSASKFARARVTPVWLTSVLALAASVGACTPAHAHGFGQRYELPLPLGLYLFGAAAVVALSLAIFGLFVRDRPQVQAPPRRDLLSGSFGRILGHPLVILAVRLVVVALFLLMLLAGFL